jgi:hypothetical protein
MPSSDTLMRLKFRTVLVGAMAEARFAGELEHPGMVGTAREVLVEKMLRPVMPPDVHFGTGKLVDCSGAFSLRTDVILYSPHIMPPALYDARMGLFPVESCLYAIEVKSCLTKEELDKAVAAALAIDKLALLPTHDFSAANAPARATAKPILALFAFRSDLVSDPAKEIERYRTADASPSPAFKAICVVGRGYWYWRDGWRCFSASADFGEVMSFLAGISNTIPRLLAVKGRPNFGNYLIHDTGGVPMTDVR